MRLESWQRQVTGRIAALPSIMSNPYHTASPGAFPITIPRILMARDLIQHYSDPFIILKAAQSQYNRLNEAHHQWYA
jgi:hypothetical protein